MEIKKEYSVLFNAISDVIVELEEVLNKGESCLRILINAQRQTEEIYISESEHEIKNESEE